MLLSEDGQVHNHSHDNSKKKKDEVSDLKKDKEMRQKLMAIICMLGDSIHNFTDGLSIGIAYQANYKIGAVTTIAMLFHEIPHEVCDFALLFNLNYNIC